MKQRAIAASVLAVSAVLIPRPAWSLTAITVNYQCEVHRVEVDEDTGTSTSTLVVDVAKAGCNAMAMDDDQTLYIAGFVDLEGAKIHYVDLATGESGVAIRSLQRSRGINSIRAIAFDREGGLIASTFHTDVQGAEENFYRIDLESEAVVPLGVFSGLGVQSLESDAEGNLWTWHLYSHLLRIDPSDLSFVDIDPLDSQGLSLQTIAFAPDGRLFGSDGDPGNLYLINTNDGSATLVATGLPPGTRGLAFIVPEPTAIGLIAWATMLVMPWRSA